MDNLRFRDKRFSISYALGADGEVIATLSGSDSELFTLQNLEGNETQQGSKNSDGWKFSLINGQKYLVKML
jgi:hypothetical protein